MKFHLVDIPWATSRIAPAIDHAVNEGEFVTLTGTTGCGISWFCQDYATRHAAEFRTSVVPIFSQPQSIILLKTIREILSPGSVPRNWRMHSAGMMARHLAMHLALSGTRCIFLDRALDGDMDVVILLRRVYEDVLNRSAQCTFVLTGTNDAFERCPELDSANGPVDRCLRIPLLTPDDCVGILAKWVPAGGQLMRSYNRQSKDAAQFADRIAAHGGFTIRSLRRFAAFWLDRAPDTLSYDLVDDFIAQYSDSKDERNLDDGADP